MNTEAKKTRNRLPVKRGFTHNGSNEPVQNPVEADGYVIKNKDGHVLVEVKFNTLPLDALQTLSKIGFRYLLNSYLDADMDVSQVKDVFENFLDDLDSGAAFEREGGFDEKAFLKVLGAIIGSDTQAFDLVERKRISFGDKTVTISHRDGTSSEVSAFDHWVSQIRTRPEYREKARELFPSRSKRGRKAKDLSSLLS